VQTVSITPQYHHGSQPVGTPQSVGIKGQFIPATLKSFSVNSEPIPAMPQSFTVNSEPIPATPQSIASPFYPP